jgi:hypothetical protein
MWSVPLLSPRLAAFPTHPIPFYLITWIISNRHNHTVSKGPVTGEGKVVGLSAQEPCRKDNSSTSSSIRHYWMWVVGLIPGHLPTEKEPTLRSEQKVCLAHCRCACCGQLMCVTYRGSNPSHTLVQPVAQSVISARVIALKC